jgi:hypothetical protein
MLRRIRRQLSYANVMATIAMFAALGGSSYAAVKLSKDSVRTSHIKNGQVRGPDLAAGAVGGRQVADGSIGVNELNKGDVSDLKTMRVVRLRGRGGASGNLQFDGGFTQHANEVVDFLGQAVVSGPATCGGVSIEIALDGHALLSGYVGATAETPTKVALTAADEYENATRLFEPGAETPHELTATASGSCESGAYDISSVAVDVLGYR